MVEPESAMIKDLSQKQSWFIYNVSPWGYAESMGSMGSFSIPSLAPEIVLADKGSANEFAVAGPLVIPGMPNETYPNERKSDRSYFQWWEKNPGEKLALEICGVGKSRKKSADLRKRGVFVSQISDYDGHTYRPISRPAKEAGSEAWVRWNAWCAEVTAARKALVQWCEYLCGYASTQASQKQTFNITEHHFQAAHLLHKTSAQCPWLEGSSEATQKENCPLCGEPVKAGVAFCPTCRQQIITDEELEVLRAAIKGKKVAEAN
jgi:hypothetical protein